MVDKNAVSSLKQSRAKTHVQLCSSVDMSCQTSVQLAQSGMLSLLACVTGRLLTRAIFPKSSKATSYDQAGQELQLRLTALGVY